MMRISSENQLDCAILVLKLLTTTMKKSSEEQLMSCMNLFVECLTIVSMKVQNLKDIEKEHFYSATKHLIKLIKHAKKTTLMDCEPDILPGFD